MVNGIKEEVQNTIRVYKYTKGLASILLRVEERGDSVIVSLLNQKSRNMFVFDKRINLIDLTMWTAVGELINEALQKVKKEYGNKLKIEEPENPFDELPI